MSVRDPPTWRRLAPGYRVGEYVIEHVLGRGAFGTVYGGIQPTIEKRVAIKVLAGEMSTNPSIVSRFVSEARAVNRIRHQNIVDIFSFGELEDGRHYLVMEWLDGETLDTYLKKRGRLSEGEAWTILMPVAAALDATHEVGITHRDLKPANIFVARHRDGSRIPKLLDFGIAKLLPKYGGLGHETRSGHAIGTPAYMSPEQCEGRNVDTAADIYAFGVMAFELLTGERPFKAATPLEIMVAHMKAEPPDPRRLQSDISDGAAFGILTMLSKSPANRPKALVPAVRAMSDTGRTTMRAGPGVALPAPPAPHRGPWLWIGGGLLVAGAAVAWGLYRWSEPEVVELAPLRAQPARATAAIEPGDGDFDPAPEAGGTAATSGSGTAVPGENRSETGAPADARVQEPPKPRRTEPPPARQRRAPEDRIEPWK